MTYVLVADKREKNLLLVSRGSGLLIGRWSQNQLKITTRRVEYPYGGHFLY